MDFLGLCVCAYLSHAHKGTPRHEVDIAGVGAVLWVTDCDKVRPRQQPLAGPALPEMVANVGNNAIASGEDLSRKQQPTGGKKRKYEGMS